VHTLAATASRIALSISVPLRLARAGLHCVVSYL
jgi:hypothetical protein